MKFNLITVFTIKENVKNNTAENTFIALHSIKSFYRNKNFLSYFFFEAKHKNEQFILHRIDYFCRYDNYNENHWCRTDN